MNWIKAAMSILLAGLALAFVGVNLKAMGMDGPASTVLLIISLYVVMAAVAALLVAVWKLE